MPPRHFEEVFVGAGYEVVDDCCRLWQADAIVCSGDREQRTGDVREIDALAIDHEFSLDQMIFLVAFFDVCAICFVGQGEGIAHPTLHGEKILHCLGIADFLGERDALCYLTSWLEHAEAGAHQFGWHRAKGIDDEIDIEAFLARPLREESRIVEVDRGCQEDEILNKLIPERGKDGGKCATDRVS